MGAIVPPFQLSAKVVSFASAFNVGGALAVTGVGFKPSAVIFLFDGELLNSVSWGLASLNISDKKYTMLTFGGVANSSGGVGQVQSAAGNVGISFDLTSLDSDGFTLNRTVNGTPGATTVYGYALCLR